MLHVNVIAELESADQRWGDVRAQTGLVSDQLLQTSAGERILGADVHGSCRDGERSSLLVRPAALHIVRIFRKHRACAHYLRPALHAALGTVQTDRAAGPAGSSLLRSLLTAQ